MRFLSVSLFFLLGTICFLAGCAKKNPTNPPGEDPEGAEYVNLHVFRHNLEVTDAFFTDPTGAASDVVAVGRNGRGLLYFSQITSTPLFVETEADILATRYEETNNILIGGAREGGSAVLRTYRGEAWEAVSHPATGNITGISAYLICTDEGEILHYSHYTGVELVFQAPAGVRFNAILSSDGEPPIDIAVGNSGNIYLRPGEGEFVDHSMAGGPDFVAVVSGRYIPTDINVTYVVGGDEIWLYFSGIWSRDYHQAPANLNDVTPLLNGEMLAVGDNGLILKRDEFGWWDDYLEDAGDLVACASMVGSEEDLKVALCDDRGQVYRGVFGDWAKTNTSADGTWPALHYSDGGASFATNGNKLMKFVGSDWTEFAVWEMGHEITDIHVIDDTHIWALGAMADGIDHFVLFYDGVGWSVMNQSSLDGFNALWCDDTGDNVFVADASGMIWWRHNDLWDPDYVPSGYHPLNGLDGTAIDDLVAVGDAGLILRRGAGGWTTETSGTTAKLLAVAGPIIVGTSGTVLKHDGGSWSPVDLSFVDTFHAVWYGGSDNIWVVGNDATVFQYKGSEWTRLLTHLPGVDFLSVQGADRNTVWIGGSEGTLLRNPDTTPWVTPLNTAN